MSDQIDRALGLGPIDEYIIDGETGELVPFEDTPTDVVTKDDIDEAFEEASRDAEMVRNNIKRLIERGFEMFENVSEVATLSQNADQYQASARFYSELIKANKELMNIHRDVFALKPPMPKAAEEAKNVTNVLITTNSEDFLDRVKAALEKKNEAS